MLASEVEILRADTVCCENCEHNPYFGDDCKWCKDFDMFEKAKQQTGC